MAWDGEAFNKTIQEKNPLEDTQAQLGRKGEKKSYYASNSLISKEQISNLIHSR